LVFFERIELKFFYFEFYFFLLRYVILKNKVNKDTVFYIGMKLKNGGLFEKIFTHLLFYFIDISLFHFIN